MTNLFPKNIRSVVGDPQKTRCRTLERSCERWGGHEEGSDVWCLSPLKKRWASTSTPKKIFDGSVKNRLWEKEYVVAYFPKSALVFLFG